MNDDEQNYDNFYSNSFLSQTSTTNSNKDPFNTEINTITITENKYHYLCPECYKFPLIDFYKYKYTCSCVNKDKQKTIKHLIDGISRYYLNNSFISTDENHEKNNDYINGLSCLEHNKIFEYFCKNCLKNLCKECKEKKDHVSHEIEVIQKINKEKMDILKKIIKEKNINYNEIISNEEETIEIINHTINCELISKPQEKELYKLINIIIEDYTYYPNYIHIFNIKNIFNFLEIKNISNEKEIKLSNFPEENDVIINKYYNSNIPMEEDIYTSLKQLNIYIRDFIIFVRVTKKSEIKNCRNGIFFYFIVLDRDGNQMQCMCFNQAAYKFNKIIEEEQVYEIKGGDVIENDIKYSRIKSDYKIVLGENTEITKKIDDGSIKMNNMTIVSIKDIQNMHLFSIVDVCVVVLNVGEKTIKNTSKGNQYLKRITIGDVSKYKIEISLWGVHSDINVKKGDILLINNVRIQEFQGRILNSYDETCLKINPPNTTKFLKELEVFKSKGGLHGVFLDLKNNSKMYNKFEENKNTYTDYIKDVVEFKDNYHSPIITAKVIQLLHDEKNFYIGCSDENCKKKLKYEEDKGEYVCPRCRKRIKKPTYYYNLNLRVKDVRSEYWITIIGKTAEYIMKCTAEKYKDYLNNKDVKKLKEITDGITFKVFNFWVIPKLEKYNNICRQRIFAYKIEPYNEKNELHK